MENLEIRFSKVFPKIKLASSSEKAGIILLFFPFMRFPGTSWGQKDFTIIHAGRRKKIKYASIYKFNSFSHYRNTIVAAKEYVRTSLNQKDSCIMPKKNG